MMKKKICALFTCCALFAAMLPSTVLADIEESAAQTEETVEPVEETEDVSVDALSFGEGDSIEIVVDPEMDEAAAIEDDTYDAGIGETDITEDSEETEVIEDAETDESYDAEAYDAEAAEAEAIDAEEEIESDDALEDAGESDEEFSEETDAESEEDVTYKTEQGGVVVEVTAPAGALPDGARLVVERFARDSEEYMDAAEAIDHDLDDTNMVALDISFMADGEEVEPTEAVTVSIDVSAILPENADASSLEVQHLIEIENEWDEEAEPEIEAVVVANDSIYTEGTIDEETAVAEFEVDSFSTFTIEWNEESGGGSIVVHIYNVNSTSIDEELDEEEYTFEGNTIEIEDVVSHLLSNALYANEYTFQYATVAYQVAQDPTGYSMTIIGGEEDSVTAVSKADTTYTVTHSGTATEVSDPDDIVIRLYYSIPTVSIITDNAHENPVNFTTSYAYFQHIDEDGAEVSYTWQLSDDSEGTITPGDDGAATYTWAEGSESGDKETVTVTMTVTYTDENGDTQTETASDTYTLTYGDEDVTISVYQTDGVTPQANARVALVDENGETVATGTTDENGDVTLYAPDGTYTVGVTYVEQTSTIGGGSTSRWTAETTVIVTEEGGTADVTLGEAITSGPGGDTDGSYGSDEEPYYYEHIDVKVAAAQIEGSSASFSDLSHVYVYDKYGNLLYYSEDLNNNPGTTDYNVLFDINDDEDQHSIVVSSEDTIVIVYEVLDEDTGEYHEYTASYTGGGTYSSDDYYLPTAINAYQLYNCLYGGDYESQEAFEAAWDSITTGVYTDSEGNKVGIAIGGYSYSIIADYLCDTRTTSGQAGLDFVIEVFDAVFEEYDIQIAKTYNDVPESYTEGDLETFTFTLQEIASVTASDDDPEAVWDTTGDNLVNTTTGTTTSWSKDDETGVWSSIINLENILEYEAEDGTNFYYYVLSENDSNTTTADPQYIGIMITVTYSSTTGRTQITASYCTLEKDEENEGVYNKSGGWTGLTVQEGTDDNGDTYDYFEIPFVNTYDAYIGISGSKVWVNDSEDDRPDSITVHLYADGVEVTDDEGNPITATATADNDWEWSFTDLPQYKTDGVTKIEYTVLEEQVSDYLPTYDYEDANEEGDEDTEEDTDESEDADESENIIVTITNAIPEVHKVVSDPAFGESTDDGLHEDEADNNDILEYRMEADHIGGAHNLVLHDFLDDQLDIDTLAIQSVTLYTGEEGDDGTVLGEGTDYEVNTGECSAPDCGLDGCSFEIHVFDEDVENLSADAYVIVIFDIEVKEGVEDFDDNYVDEVDNWVGLSFLAYNVWTYADDPEPEPGYGTPEETETYSYGFELYKYDADTDEPLAGVEFVLSRDGSDGTVYAQFDVTDSTYLLTGWTDSKDDATAIVTGSDGKAVVEGLHDGTFSIEETKAPEGYQRKVGTMTVTITVDEEDPLNPTITATNADVDGLEVQIENTVGETIEIIGSKTWDDSDDADGIRPESITIHLLADGEEIDSMTVTADDSWAWSFADLPEYQDDGTTEIAYTITEDAVEGYETTVSDYDVTNSHTPETETINIEGSKTWDDSDDADGTRPESITIRLLADGEEVDSVSVTADDDWAWTFADMPKYQEDGTTEITYTITEDAVDNYTAVIDGYDVTNTLTPPTESTMNIKVTKVWEGDSEDIRPASVGISLLVNGNVSATILLNADNDWTYTWTDLPVYDDQDAAIQYTVKEASVPEGYTVSYGDWQSDNDTYTIIVTNTFDEELLTGPGPVIDNPDGSNPTPTGTTKTGDTNMMYLWLILMIAAAALVVVAVSLRTRPSRMRR